MVVVRVSVLCSFACRFSFRNLVTCELQSRRSRCRYPRHVGNTSDRTLCHGVTVAVQYLPARGLAADARESDDSVALDVFRQRVRVRQTFRLMLRCGRSEQQADPLSASRDTTCERRVHSHVPANAPPDRMYEWAFLWWSIAHCL